MNAVDRRGADRSYSGGDSYGLQKDSEYGQPLNSRRSSDITQSRDSKKALSADSSEKKLEKRASNDEAAGAQAPTEDNPKVVKKKPSLGGDSVRDDATETKGDTQTKKVVASEGEKKASGAVLTGQGAKADAKAMDVDSGHSVQSPTKEASDKSFSKVEEAAVVESGTEKTAGPQGQTSDKIAADGKQTEGAKTALDQAKNALNAPDARVSRDGKLASARMRDGSEVVSTVKGDKDAAAELLNAGKAESVSKSQKDFSSKTIEAPLSQNTEKTAKAAALASASNKKEELKSVDREKFAKDKGDSGSSDAKEGGMHLKSALKTTETAKSQPAAFERPAMDWNGKDVNAKAKKKGGASAKVVTAEMGTAATSKAPKVETANTMMPEFTVDRNVLTSMNSSKSFEVQITRDVQSNSAADAVKAVRQAFNQIAEAQPSKMRFSLNMANGERIDIQVVQREGGLQVRLAAQSAELRDALTRSWDSLTQNAQAKGIRLVAPVIEAPANSFNLERGNQQQQQQQQSATDRQNQNSDSRNERQQQSSNDARERENFREAYRENLRENARRRQESLNDGIALSNTTPRR